MKDKIEKANPKKAKYLDLNSCKNIDDIKTWLGNNV